MFETRAQAPWNHDGTAEIVENSSPSMSDAEITARAEEQAETRDGQFGGTDEMDLPRIAAESEQGSEPPYRVVDGWTVRHIAGWSFSSRRFGKGMLRYVVSHHDLSAVGGETTPSSTLGTLLTIYQPNDVVVGSVRTDSVEQAQALAVAVAALL